ncbi:unnamed protein product [Sphagnum jensenii]|uniref:Uncharacterized protein n=1 Tax=Sphagnum jensenii TaxID=128206 RepID=A0ABP1C1G6_9BRYO
MFWRVAGLSTSSPVESVLDKDGYTLEELLDEEEIIQECKALNSRLINFLRGKVQVRSLLCFVIEEPPENADNKRAFKFPFIACEIFTCDIDVIFKTLVEDDALMDFLFSFLEPGRPHGTLLAGYFSKVVVSLLLRKTVPVMQYLQVHQEILMKLVDLIGITSIMEILIRLVGADEHIYAFHVDSLQWLADTDLLEMLVDKLSPLNSSEVHANAAETLSAITRIAQSALASKLASPKFVGKLFHHVLEDPESKSTVVHALSVCISLLDPKRAATIAAAGVARGQHVTDPVSTANPDTVEGMLQRLGDLLKVLDVSAEDKVLFTTYGQLQPPLGIHRLKIVEFIAVLLRTNSEGARKELISSGAIQLVLKLFFDYPFNNMLHHQVENIVSSCLESNNQALLDHLFQDCDFVTRLLAADESPYVPESKPTKTKSPTKIGSLGHLTRIANRMIQASASNSTIKAHLQANPKWSDWILSVLQPRNMIENVFQWSCGRPTAAHDRTVESDDDDGFRDRDYDISNLTSNLSHDAYRYSMFDNEDAEEGHGPIERDEEDVFFDDESAEVVISSLRLGEEQASSVNWFTLQDDRTKEESSPTFLISSSLSQNEDGLITNPVSPPNSNGGSSSDDEVVLGEDDDLVDTASSANNLGSLNHKLERLENEMDPNKEKQESTLIQALELPEWMLGLRETVSPLEGTSGQDVNNESNPFKQLREEEDESGGHKRPKQRKTPKKKLSRPCPPVIEDLTETTSKGQSSQQATVTVTESSSEAGPSERPPVPAAPEELLSGISGIEEQGTVVLKPINQESNTEVQLLVAESSHLLKKKTNVVTTTTPPSLGRGAAASCSPSGSHKTKRRKPLPKPTPGQNVARFR